MGVQNSQTLQKLEVNCSLWVGAVRNDVQYTKFVRMSVPPMCNAQGIQKRVFDPLGLELQIGVVVVNTLPFVGKQPKSCGRRSSVLNHGVLSSAPTLTYVFCFFFSYCF